MMEDIAASIYEILTMCGMFAIVALVPMFICHMCRIESNEDR